MSAMAAGLVALLGASACDDLGDLGDFYVHGTGGAAAGGGSPDGGAPECTAADAQTACDDMNPCTGESCSTGMCAHSFLAKGTPCGQGRACNGLGVCVVPGVWSMRFGGAGDQFGRRLAVDSANRVITAGSFEGAIDFGGGTLSSPNVHHLYLAKFAADGSYVFGKSFGGGNNQAVPGVVVDADDNIIMGGHVVGTLTVGGNQPLFATASSPYLAKFDKVGNHLFSEVFSFSPNNVGEAIASVARSGERDIILFGTIAGNGVISFSTGTPSLPPVGVVDVFVAKFDGHGHPVWSKRFGGSSSTARVSGLVVDDGGKIYLTGAFTGTIDLGGPTLSATGPNGEYSLYVAKLDEAGNYLWSKQFGDDVDASGCGGSDVAWLGCGILLGAVPKSIVLTGSFSGALDFEKGFPLKGPANHAAIFVASIDPEGGTLWSTSFSGSKYVHPTGGAFDAKGHLILSGSFGGAGMDFLCGSPLQGFGQQDIFLVTLDAKGKCLAQKSFGDAAEQFVGEIAASGAGDLFMTGGIRGSVDFGEGPLTTQGSTDTDVFLARFGP